MDDKITRTDQEWKDSLTREQYAVLREKGTERPFSGEYVSCKEDGIYRCTACGAELFSSGTKFDSGTGWPSFTEPVNRQSVDLHPDHSYGMRRVEVTCKRCGSHLGHVFDDGPGPDGLRYCINSVALKLDKQSSTP